MADADVDEAADVADDDGVDAADDSDEAPAVVPADRSRSPSTVRCRPSAAARRPSSGSG